MLIARYAKYRLDFKEPARTSRETLTSKTTYFIKVFDDSNSKVYGIGECPLFRGLSSDHIPDYEVRLKDICNSIEYLTPEMLTDLPSIRFGVETALMDFRNGGNRILYPSVWTAGESGICINGLVWMGSIEEMQIRIAAKLKQGFRCLKFKIGGERFEDEYALLAEVRKEFPLDVLTIRLDANGAFMPYDAEEKLRKLSMLGIHSIEQPIKAGQWAEMARLCRVSPIPIALDEELIGVNKPEHKIELLKAIKPAYIILKPALCGGLSGAMEWISCADLTDIGWWITSALESNIGLNALAQWVGTLNPEMPQGLGTGELYTNNIASPLQQRGDSLFYDTTSTWNIPELEWL